MQFKRHIVWAASLCFLKKLNIYIEIAVVYNKNEIRKIIREAIDNLLNEGRFDKFTGDIIDFVWGCIRSSKKEKHSETQYHFKIKEPLEIELFVTISREKNEDFEYTTWGNTILGKK